MRCFEGEVRIVVTWQIENVAFFGGKEKYISGSGADFLVRV